MQDLDNFFFIVSNGDQRKNAVKLPKLYIGFWGFFAFGPPTKIADILRGFRKSQIHYLLKISAVCLKNW